MTSVSGKFLLANGADALTASPDYVEVDAAQFAGFTTHRGRDYLTDRTDAGTGEVNFNDKTGILDPTNTDSPLYPWCPNSPAQLQILNPFTGSYVPVFTGLTQTIPQTVRYQGAAFNQGTVELSDMFSLLAIKEVPPGLDFLTLDTPGTYPSGEPPKSPNESGDTTYAAQTVQDRIYAILADAGVPASLIQINSGNVYVQSTVYSPGSYILAALQDAADGEYPGVSNLYVDRNGILNFKGRLYRFNPSDYDVPVWKVGDLPTVAELSPSCALVAADDFVIDVDVSKIINNALFTPENILNSEIGGDDDIDLGYGGLHQIGCLIYHPASVAQYGPRPITGQDLIVAGWVDATNIDQVSAIYECRKFGIFYVWNFNQPQVNVTQIKLRPVPVTRSIAEYHWNMALNAEIGDIIALSVQTPYGQIGVPGDPVNYYIEGISYDLVAGGTTPDMTVTYDLSPQAYYTESPLDWGTPPEE